jgi:hypothetical protein
VPASLGALRHDDIGSGVYGSPGLVEVRDLHDQHRSGAADGREERPGVTEGQHDGSRMVRQRSLDRGHVGGPALKSHTPGLVGTCGGYLQLMVQPAGIFPAAADQPQPAAVGNGRR